MVSGVPEEASDQFENGTYDLDAGKSIEIGGLNLTCAEGGEACTIIVMDTTVMSSGGNLMTSSETPPETPTTGTTDWLFPGTVASAAAGSAAKNAVEDAYVVVGGGRPVDEGKNRESNLGGDIWVGTPDDDVNVFTYEYYDRLGYVGSWGYWNHPSLPDYITYVQEVFSDDPTDPATQPQYKRILGLMDNGYFGIGYGEAQDFQANGSWDVSFSSFYSTNGELSQILDPRTHNRYTGTPDIGGATWSGSAFGIQIASQIPVFGPATLTFGGSYSQGGFRLDRARLLLDVDWNNGQEIQISAEAFVNENGTTLSDEEFMNTNTGNFFRDRRTFRGSFAGENAEEAFGVFDSQGYIGAFGAKRQ